MGVSIDGVECGKKPLVGAKKGGGGARKSALGTTIDCRPSIVASGFLKTVRSEGADAKGGTEGKPKMTSLQATMMLFCNAMGAAIALSPKYPRQAGWLGFVISIALVAIVAAIAEISLFDACVATKATCFADLCKGLPKWMHELTSWMQIVWGLLIVGLYTEFSFNGFVGEYWKMNPKEDEWKELPYGDYLQKAIVIYAPLTILQFLIGIPSNYSGPLAQLIFSKINSCVIWSVVLICIVKGILKIRALEVDLNYVLFLPGDWWTATLGFMEVTVLLGGAMFQSCAIPWLSSELRPESRERGGRIAAVGVATLQGGTFMMIGLIGYFAVGQDSKVDVFYDESGDKWQKPLCRALQLGLIVLMLLSVPLVALPTKVEMSAKWQKLTSSKDSDLVLFEDLPMYQQMVYNAIAVGLGAAVPMLCRSEMFFRLITIGAGTMANWMNTILVCIILYYKSVVPRRKNGESVWDVVLRIAIVGLFSFLCLCFSVLDIVKLFTEKDKKD